MKLHEDILLNQTTEIYFYALCKKESMVKNISCDFCSVKIQRTKQLHLEIHAFRILYISEFTELLMFSVYIRTFTQTV